MKYKREQLLNLAWEMGYPIKSDRDLIDFETELIINGDLDESIRDDASDQKQIEDIAERTKQMQKRVDDLHKAMFNTSPEKTATAVKDITDRTKAELILKNVRKNMKK